MYVFSKSGGNGGFLLNTKSNDIMHGGGKNKEKQEIVPLGLVFINKSSIHKNNYKDIQTISSDTIDDKSWNKLYRKVKHSKNVKKNKK